MIPEELRRQLFQALQTQDRTESQLADLAKFHLDLHRIPWRRSSATNGGDQETVLHKLEAAIKLCEFPSLAGNNIAQHYHSISTKLFSSLRWKERAIALSRISIPPIPDFSSLSTCSPGWTCHDTATGTSFPVLFPPESEDLFFDIESCPHISQHAVMAVAVSSSAWYTWRSPLFDDIDNEGHTNHHPEESQDESPNIFVQKKTYTTPCLLIPMGKNHLLIGHNVSFDRAHIREEYSLDDSFHSISYLDTMALHCAVSGLSSQQRTLWLKYKKISKGPEEDEDELANEIDTEDESKAQSNFEAYVSSGPGKWLHHTSSNSLIEAASLHCGIPLASKENRNFLLNAKSLHEVDSLWTDLLSYCAKDVSLTHQLYCKVFPKFLAYNPHPVTFLSLLLMGKMILPTDSEWFSWIHSCDLILKENVRKLEEDLNKVALDLIEKLTPDQRWREDPWLKELDWTPVPARFCLLKKPKKGKKQKGISPEGVQPIHSSTNWQTDLNGLHSVDEKPSTILSSTDSCSGIESPREYDYTRPIGNAFFFGKPTWYKKLWDSTRQTVSIAPKMTIVPYLLGLTWNHQPVHFLGQGKGWASVSPLSTRTSYEKIELKDAESVGSLISKRLWPLWKSGKLSAARHPQLAKRCFEITVELSFWTSYRTRVRDVMPEPLSGVDAPNANALGIIPRMCSMGTITRRATDPLWLTSSANSKESVLGSDLKSRIRAPPGYKFVGADVDSQELWISSLLGDAQFGAHGATALSWMGLAGTKAQGTDLHSVTAALLGGGATRDDAKIFNYARFYGSGVKFATDLLKSIQPELTLLECQRKAQALYHQTKGEVSRVHGKNSLSLLCGGSESYMFNALAALGLGANYALGPHSGGPPITPVLGCRITDALAPNLVGFGSQFSTSRMNWVVQSSAVDYLHLLLTGMYWLVSKYSICARLAITIHDEVRWLVKEADVTRAAIALQIANLWTRAMFSQALGIHDLPLSVAFFSSVEIDSILRKDPTSPCLSPLRNEPIPPGLSLTFPELLSRRRHELAKEENAPLSTTELLGLPNPNFASLPTTFDGCTHYPPLFGLIAENMSDRIDIILAQDQFELHPEFSKWMAAQRSPYAAERELPKKQHASKKKPSSNELDEFGDPVKPRRGKMKRGKI